jgi:hypothetical protein
MVIVISFELFSRERTINNTSPIIPAKKVIKCVQVFTGSFIRLLPPLPDPAA